MELVSMTLDSSPSLFIWLGLDPETVQETSLIIPCLGFSWANMTEAERGKRTFAGKWLMMGSGI